MPHARFAIAAEASGTVLADPIDIADPDRLLALGYVPAALRDALAALFALDERLGGIVARTREPAIGLMRLVWWRDALERLDSAPPPAEPLLVALASCGIAGAALAAMTAGWEALLDDPALDDATVALHGRERGARLFMLAGTRLDPADREAARLEAAGAGWALTDLARRCSVADRAAAIRAQAQGPLATAMTGRWPRALRPLGQLAALARHDAAGAPLAGRWRAVRVLRHQLTGR